MLRCDKFGGNKYIYSGSMLKYKYDVFVLFIGLVCHALYFF